jgi:hypothetical protein
LRHIKFAGLGLVPPIPINAFNVIRIELRRLCVVFPGTARFGNRCDGSEVSIGGSGVLIFPIGALRLVFRDRFEQRLGFGRLAGFGASPISSSPLRQPKRYLDQSS